MLLTNDEAGHWKVRHPACMSDYLAFRIVDVNDLIRISVTNPKQLPFLATNGRSGELSVTLSMRTPFRKTTVPHNFTKECSSN